MVCQNSRFRKTTVRLSISLGGAKAQCQHSTQSNQSLIKAITQRSSKPSPQSHRTRKPAKPKSQSRRPADPSTQQPNYPVPLQVHPPPHAHRKRSTCRRKCSACQMSWVASPLAITSFCLDSHRKAQRARSLGSSPKAVSATFLRKANASGPMRSVGVTTKGTTELMLSEHLVLLNNVTAVSHRGFSHALFEDLDASKVSKRRIQVSQLAGSGCGRGGAEGESRLFDRYISLPTNNIVCKCFQSTAKQKNSHDYTKTPHAKRPYRSNSHDYVQWDGSCTRTTSRTSRSVQGVAIPLP